MIGLNDYVEETAILPFQDLENRISKTRPFLVSAEETPQSIQRCGTVRLIHASKSANPERQLFYNTRLTPAGYYKIVACLG